MDHSKSGRLNAMSIVSAAAAVLGIFASGASVAADPIFSDDNGKPFTSRLFASKKITVAYTDCAVESVKFSETARNTRLSDDITQLLKALSKAQAFGGTCLSGAEFEPKLERSTIKVVAFDAAGKELSVHTIVYGPAEHLSLGIDLPVTNRKTLKYDEATKSLVPKDENAQVYLSLNYSLGDVFTKPASPKDRTDIKLMVLASRRPLDSYGVGIGYRMDFLKDIHVDMQGFSLFAGYFSTRADQIADGVVQLDQGRKRAWRVGVSYDLSTGLKWAKF